MREGSEVRGYTWRATRAKGGTGGLYMVPGPTRCPAWWALAGPNSPPTTGQGSKLPCRGTQMKSPPPDSIKVISGTVAKNGFKLTHQLLFLVLEHWAGYSVNPI